MSCRIRRAASIGLVLTSGCAAPEPASDEPIAKASEALVPPIYGMTAAVTSSFMSRRQAETALAVGLNGSSNLIVAAYNDESSTEATMTYDALGSRTVTAGTSLLGWSWSSNDGATWHKGVCSFFGNCSSTGKLAPPPGYAILWGDPSVAAAKSNPSYVYLSSLTSPMSKWPGSWLNSFGVDNTPLGGACIARSVDGGKTFSFPAVQPCLVTPLLDYYDGSSLATGADGKVYAAFRNVPWNRIDVWQAPTLTGQFTMLDNPFEGGDIMDHPRMRVGADNRVVVLGLDDFGRLWITKRLDNGWHAPVHVASGVAHEEGIHFTDPDGGTFMVRTGPQFSFDVGAASAAGNDAIRIAWISSGDHHLRVSRCAADLSSCAVGVAGDGWAYPLPGQWDPGDQLHPTVAFSPASGTSPARWKISFQSRETPTLGANEVALVGATLTVAGGSRSLSDLMLITGSQRPCPFASGFWGDYDGMVAVSPSPTTGAPRFLRGFTDSSGEACTSLGFTADPMHVSVVRFE